MTRATLIVLCAVCLNACAEDAPPPHVRGADVYLAPDTTAIRGLVADDSTMDSMLRVNGLAADAVHDVIAAARTVFDPRKLRTLQPFLLERTNDGALRLFEYEIDADSFLRITLAPDSADGLRAEVLPIPKTLEQVTRSGAIDEATPSLFQSIDAAGEGADLAVAMAEVFAGEIDFNSDLQPGDRIDVLFERFMRDNEFVGYGAIKGAVLVNDSRRIVAVGFTDTDGRPAWYDEDGRSLKRQFLQSPLPFDPRVTSKFSYRRLHPVHGTSRAHLGVDYGAPAGTRVNAVASGVVELAGWAGEGGRVVRLRHAGGYQTAYLHLSAIAPGIRPGVRVEQGDAIGRVGSSGTATGPHLDYRIIKNGTYVNPLVELKKMPKGDPVAPDARAAFERARDAVLARFPPSETR